jgi:hypothetical protein
MSRARGLRNFTIGRTTLSCYVIWSYLTTSVLRSDSCQINQLWTHLMTRVAPHGSSCMSRIPVLHLAIQEPAEAETTITSRMQPQVRTSWNGSLTTPTWAWALGQSKPSCWVHVYICLSLPDQVLHEGANVAVHLWRDALAWSYLLLDTPPATGKDVAAWRFGESPYSLIDGVGNTAGLAQRPSCCH